jgi:hypothetical protein
MRLSRSSSFTRRVRKRSSEKVLRRSSPSVRGRLMKGTPNQLFPIIRVMTHARFAQQAIESMQAPVASGGLAGARGAAKIGKQILQVCGDGLNSFAFGAHSKQLLLEIKVERQ